MKALLWFIGLMALAVLALVFVQPVPPVMDLPSGAGMDATAVFAGLPFIGAAGMIVNQSNLDNLFTGFKAAFNTGFRGVTPLWSQVATLVPSSTSQEHYAWLGQFPKLREWIGDRQIKGMSAFDYTIKNKEWESTINVLKKAIEDDQFGIYGPLFLEMGDAAAKHPDELIFALLQAGFTTPCYDGQYMFDTDHPVGDGVVSNHGGGAGAQWYLLDVSRPLKPLIFQQRQGYQLQPMNRPEDEGVFMRREYRYGVDARSNVGFGFWQQSFGSKVTLDVTGYTAARAAMLAFKSDEGRPLGINPNLLVVPPSLEGAARKLLLNERAADGSTNEWVGSAKMLMVPWLT